MFFKLSSQGSIPYSFVVRVEKIARLPPIVFPAEGP
jgi:hypothetical protein